MTELVEAIQGVLLEDRFSEFQAAVKDLGRKPASLEKELEVKQAKLERLRTGYLSQLALKEVEQAAVLNKQIAPLAKEVESLAIEISAHGQSPQTLISNAPGSELFDLALGIAAEAADVCPQLEAELQKFVLWTAAELKEQYLEKIGDFADKLSELWAANYAGLVAQKYVPEDLRTCKKVRLIAPTQSVFEITIEEVAEHYRPLTRTSLPD